MPFGIGQFGQARGKSISVLASHCKRTRYRRNDCRRCLDACPENAILLSARPAISEACTECGLCVTACPTEVFQDKDRHEQNLLGQAKRQRESRESAGRKEALSIHCKRAARPGKRSFPVPCLGNVTAYFISSLALLGYDELRFTRGACSDCRLAPGEKLFHRSCRDAGALLEGTGSATPVIALRENNAVEEAALSRRRVFSPLAAAFTQARDVVTRPHHASGPVSDCVRLPGRNLFRSVFLENVTAEATVLKYGPDLPWGMIGVDEKRCSTCGICAAVCPSGALVADTEDGCKVLRFSPSSCLNCRLCKDACPESAVYFHEKFSLADVFRNEVQIVARVEQATCSLCGDSMWRGTGKLCPPCDRLGLNSTYVPLRASSDRS